MKTMGSALRAGLWVTCLAWAWSALRSATTPGPLEVLGALRQLWWHGGLGPELLATTKLIGASLALTVVLSLTLAWSTVVPALAPVASLVSKLRFLGLTGLVFPFTLLTGGGFGLKTALLTFGMTTFLVTAVARIVAEVPAATIDHARSLGAGRARIVWECVIRAPLHRTLDAIRQNVAMGWAMITMVEGIARSDGGVGALLLAENKHFRLAEVDAVLVAILGVGLVIDGSIGALTRFVCPHVNKRKR